MKNTEEETHCISCGNELSDQEVYIGVGHCDRCIEEACGEYWKHEREEHEEGN